MFALENKKVTERIVKPFIMENIPKIFELLTGSLLDSEFNIIDIEYKNYIVKVTYCDYEDDLITLSFKWIGSRKKWVKKKGLWKSLWPNNFRNHLKRKL